jgi:hypothetical protein
MGDKNILSAGKKDGEEKSVREGAGGREEVGKWWAAEIGRRVKSGIGQLFGLQSDVAGEIIGDEANHKVTWERPWLTAVVTDIFDTESGLFTDFPCGTFFEALADLKKAGDEAVMTCGCMGVGLDEKDIFASAHKDEDGGGDGGKDLVSAGGTATEDG